MAENLAVTETDVEGEIARYAAQSGMEPKAARLQLKRAGQLERLAVEIQERKLLGFLREHAVIADEEAAA